MKTSPQCAVLLIASLSPFGVSCSNDPATTSAPVFQTPIAGAGAMAPGPVGAAGAAGLAGSGVPSTAGSGAAGVSAAAAGGAGGVGGMGGAGTDGSAGAAGVAGSAEAGSGGAAGAPSTAGKLPRVTTTDGPGPFAEVVKVMDTPPGGWLIYPQDIGR